MVSIASIFSNLLSYSDLVILPVLGLKEKTLEVPLSLTEPVLGQFRDLLRSFGLLSSGIDFSPMIAIITLNYLKFFIIRILLNL